MLRLALIPALLLQDSTGDGQYGLWWWVFAAGFVAYIVLVWRFGGGKTPPEPEPELPPLSDNYGAADFAAQQTAMVGGIKDLGGVFFGKSSSPAMRDFDVSKNPGVPVCSTPENHTLIVARTRTGKGTRVIIPTLLKSLKSSCIIIDPKGENAIISARARAASQHVHILNPWGALSGKFEKLGFSPATYNPLDILDAADPNATSIAQELAAAVCPVEGGKDSFWKGSAGDLLMGVLLYLAYQPGEQKTLARARQITSMSRKGFTEILTKMVAIEAFDGAIRDSADRFMDMAADTYSGITTNLQQSMKFLADPQIKKATASSTFRMSDLTGFGGMDRPTSLYIVAPTGKLKTQGTWLRLMIAAAMSTFKSKPEGQGYRCMFLMDEFANLGFIDEMPVEISVAAGHGIDFTLIVQGLDQLKKTYGDSDGTILGNCAFKWFCNVGDNDTAEYLSKYLGKKTVRTISKGESEGHPVGPSGHAQEGKSTTYGEVQRDLLQPSEILNLGKNVAILIAPGSLPKYLRPVDYWQLPEAFVMFRNSSPKLFWDPPLFYDPNPLNPDSRGSGSVPKPKAPSSQTPEKSAGEGGIKKGYDYGLYGDYNPERKPYFNPDLHSSDPKPKPSQPPTPEKPAEKASSSNYDMTYYSPDRIAEREREAAKKASPPAPKKRKNPDGNYDLETGTFEPHEPKKFQEGDWDPDADSFKPFPPDKPEGGGDT